MNTTIVCDMGKTVECSVTALELGLNPFIALGLTILIIIFGYILYRVVKLYADLYEDEIKKAVGGE